MGKKLAIKGHATRGKEVIELLQMMGGENTLIVSGYKLSGYEPFNLYYINDNGVINYKYHSLDKDMLLFTLEEFLEKYPYKIGDKIPAVWGNPCTVKSMSWDENYKTVMYGFEETVFVVRGDELYVNNIINNHTESTKMKNVLSELYEHIKATPKEELEREFKEIKEWSNVGPTVEEFMDFCDKVNKKPVYPKTYKGCCDVLGVPPYYNLRYHTYEHGWQEYATIPELCSLQDKLNTLSELIICQSAYWKVAGEETGLGKPWEPDWNSFKEIKYCLYTIGNKIKKGEFRDQNIVLAFPTADMRDLFYENFKNLIEECKELL